MFYSGFMCDNCGKRKDFVNGSSKAGLTFLARERGWSVGKRILCPDCRTIRIRK